MNTTQTTAKHTPTPWYVRFDPALGEPFIASASNVISQTCSRGTYEERVANAEFTVRAVNSHEELLAACKGLLEDCYSEIGTPAEIARRRLAVRENARAAIAKAEGHTS